MRKYLIINTREIKTNSGLQRETFYLTYDNGCYTWTKSIKQALTMIKEFAIKLINNLTTKGTVEIAVI